eukprot:SAG31_NODE_15995_length_728_cov_0.796502_1_plen_74_part_00
MLSLIQTFDVSSFGDICFNRLLHAIRLPGARKFVRQLLLVKLGYVDSGPKRAALEDGFKWSSAVDSALSEVFG